MKRIDLDRSRFSDTETWSGQHLIAKAKILRKVSEDTTGIHQSKHVRKIWPNWRLPSRWKPPVYRKPELRRVGSSVYLKRRGKNTLNCTCWFGVKCCVSAVLGSLWLSLALTYQRRKSKLAIEHTQFCMLHCNHSSNELERAIRKTVFSSTNQA